MEKAVVNLKSTAPQGLRHVEIRWQERPISVQIYNYLGSSKALIPLFSSTMVPSNRLRPYAITYSLSNVNIIWGR